MRTSIFRSVGTGTACVGWLALAAACGGAAPATETPADPGAAAPPPAGEGAPPAAAGDERNGCDLYARAAIRCSTRPAPPLDAGAADGEGRVSVSDGEGRVSVFASEGTLEDVFHDRCRNRWSGDGGPDPARMAAAIEVCEETACAQDLDEWDRCVVRQFGAGAAVAPRDAGRTVPPSVRLAAPRAYDPAREPCAVLSDWLFECAIQAMPDDVSGEAQAEVRRLLDERLCGRPGEDGAVPISPARLAACAGVACGEMGSDLMRCIIESPAAPGPDR